MFLRATLLLLAAAAAAQEIPPQFKQYCAACHGDRATGTDRGPGLINSRPLRSRSEERLRNVIRNGTRGGMPAFPLADSDLNTLARAVRSWNASAFDAQPAGDRASGKRLFDEQCKSCHMVRGLGGSNGPDLSEVGRQLTVREMEQTLTDPSSRKGQQNGANCPGWAFCPSDPWAVVKVRMKNGDMLRGFARSQGPHDLQLQAFDGKMHMLTSAEWEMVETEKISYMPALKASVEERRNLIAYLSSLDGVPKGPLTGRGTPVSQEAIRQVEHPKSGEWPGYHGEPSGNRHSALTQIDSSNAARLKPIWSYTLPHASLQTTPLVADGVMYVTAPNQVCALDSGTGREIWCYLRNRGDATLISGDAAKGAQRGAALLGDRIFFTTDDAHLVALNRLTGALMWQVFLPQSKGKFGSTGAPMVVGDLVVAGVSGGDSPLRGFLAAYKATTGEQAWRFWPVPKRGEPAADTWGGTAIEVGGGATWLTGSYDPSTETLYWPTGNPYPDTDGSERKGDNLYTDCVIALDAKTGKLKWHFQFTPHDLWDWDATEPLVLVDAKFKGRDRKLLLQANRNGFFYVLDRTTGEFLLGTPFVERLTWATGLDAKGRPILAAGNKPTPGGTKTCPAVRGATNWYATAYNPDTKLFYVMAVEDCGIYRQTGNWFVPSADPANPPRKVLRALDIETGKIVWEVPQIGPPESNYSGVLSTAGGLLFYGESGGSFAAADARTGKTLWHFNTGQAWKASPMTYMEKGRQYVAIGAGGNIFAFGL
jgi:PQQ-dependent dehydrogenase (methanol/ethanol family)